MTSIKEQLSNYAQDAKQRNIEQLFASGTRIEELCLEVENCYFDFSKSQVSPQELELLKEFAHQQGVKEKITNMFSGKPINFTEDRSVLHVALRDYARDWLANGKDANDYKNIRAKASEFAAKIYNGELLSKSGKPFSAILHIGIGGSDLGPRFVYSALKALDNNGPELRFCSNVEPTDFIEATNGLNPSETLIVCVSKTFTTIETMTNFAIAREWLKSAISDDISSHLVAISSAPDKAVAINVPEDRIFGFDEWVGGRFSVWSTVGLSLEMALGHDIIAKFLAGAQAMDKHFGTSEPSKNIPFMAGLIGYWNHTYLGYTTRAVVPYAARLRLLPQFLQQLDMESNGKGVDINNNKISFSGPVLWGSEGTNAQHAYFQHLHQSPQITPVEFILIKDGGTKYNASNQLTLANALAQSEALLRGKSLDAVVAEMRQAGKSEAEINKIAPHRVFSGNRPSISIILPKLGAFELGLLLAFYEHRVLVEGAMWGINSFDQWGVELGKVIATAINKDLSGGDCTNRDLSTANLIKILSQPS